jgi:ABC-type uncharacterized transport system auxiliary subunit
MDQNTLWIVSLLLLLIGSCVDTKQPSLEINHYTLEYASPKPGDGPQLPVILEVARFSAAPVYNTREMVYRDRSFKRETYTYHRWRAHPADLVSDYLARDMRQSGLFRAVVLEESKVSPTHVLEGSVDEFFEWDAPEGWKAVLTISVTLIKAKETDTSKRILFQKTFHAVQPCEEKTPKALAEAMSQSMSRVSEEVIKTVYASIRSSQ